MKIIISMLMLIILSISVLAELDITELNVYKNNRKVTGLDEDGGTISNIKTGDIIDFKISIKNNYNETIDDILISGSLNGEGSELNTFDLTATSQVTKTLSVLVPNNIELKNYGFDLELIGELNVNPDLEISIPFTFQVNSKTDEQASVTSVLSNISSQYNTILNQYTSFIMTEKELKEYKYDCENRKGQLNVLKDEKSKEESRNKELENKIITLNSQIQLYQEHWLSKVQCDNITSSRIQEYASANSGNSWFWLLAIGGGAVYWFKFRKEETPSQLREIAGRKF